MTFENTSKPINLFVYGTLKRGQCRASILDGQTFLADARTTPEYRMYNCGSYPALVEGGQNSIKGELWQIDARAKTMLDRVEGAPTLYDLQPVKLESHPDLECHSYIYKQSTRFLKDCGDCW